MKEGRIYIIACEPMEAVKIGFTTGEPRNRLKSLQTGCPAKLTGICHFPGTIEEEQKLHEAFGLLHIQGEWFRAEGKLLDFICFIRQQGIRADRATFISALHDVLMQGIWTWDDMPPEDEDYYDTGDWEPFRKELWDAFGPWQE